MINKRVLIFGITLFLAIASYFSAETMEEKSIKAQQSLSKTKATLANINQIQQHYRTKEENDKMLEQVLKDYAIASRKKTKSGVEFTLEGLRPKQLDIFVKKLINTNFKIEQFQIQKEDQSVLRLYCKVVF